MGPETSRREQYYRYVDAEGRVYITSSAESLPQGARAKAELIELSPQLTRREQTVATGSNVPELHWASFAAGVAVTLLLGWVFRLLPQRLRWLPRLAIVAALAAAGAGLYFGYLRQTTGAGSAPFASPSALIQDARGAVEKVEAHRRAQEAELRAIQGEAK